MAAAPLKPDEDEKIKMQEHLIDAMRPKLEEFLEPSKILSRLNGIDQGTREIINGVELRGSRRTAVVCLIDAVLKQNIVSEFIQVLRRTGFKRFLVVLDDRKIPNKTSMAAEYSEFLVRLLEGDIIEFITDPTYLLPNLIQSEILDEDTAQDIRVIYENKGHSRGCQYLFKCMPRNRSDWPFDFFQAMKEHFPAALRHIEVDADEKAAAYSPPSEQADQGPDPPIQDDTPRTEREEETMDTLDDSSNEEQMDISGRVKLYGSRCDEAREQIHNTMIKIENYLNFNAVNLKDPEITALKEKRPPNRNSHDYNQWAMDIRLLAIKKEIEHDPRMTWPRSFLIEGSLGNIVAITRHLQVYNVSLDIHDLVRLSDVLEYLERTLSLNLDNDLKTYRYTHLEIELNGFNEVIKSILNSISENENPSLEILKNEIIKLMKENGDDSLGLIFVRTRGTCYAICEWMKSDAELGKLNAEPFTGASAHEEEADSNLGMTRDQQDAAIARFRSGTTKLLVATSDQKMNPDMKECAVVHDYHSN